LFGASPYNSWRELKKDLAMSKKIRILLVDDHLLFSQALRRLLSGSRDIECVGMAGDGEEAIRLAKHLKPDVALIDVAIPKIDGIQTAKQIGSDCPGTAILMLTAYVRANYILSSIEVGVKGYLPKTVSPVELLTAIRMAHRGQSVFYSDAVDFIQSSLASKEQATIGVEVGRRLSRREIEVVSMAARGMSNKEIAFSLFLSENTVRTHMFNACRKLGADSRTEAVVKAHREGIIDIDAVGDYASNHQLCREEAGLNSNPGNKSVQ